MQQSIKSIQFLRFLAASLVVFSHCMLAIDLYFKGHVSKSELYFANVGGVGVHVFFVISGFIMIYTSFVDKTRKFAPANFFVRRFIRIFPIYWVYCASYLTVHQSLFGYYELSLGDIVKTLLLLPGYSPLIIGPAWTLSFELYFYLCFGFFMILGPLKGLVTMTLFYLASIAIQLYFHSDNAAFHLVTDSLLIEFLAGAWIGYFFVSGISIRRCLSSGLLFLAIAGFVSGFVFGYHRLPSILIWGVPSTFLVGGCVFGEKNGHLATIVQRCSFLGDSSYSLYLIHILLIDIFFRAFLAVSADPGYGYVEICLVITVICIAIAVLLLRFHRTAAGEVLAGIREKHS